MSEVEKIPQESCEEEQEIQNNIIKEDKLQKAIPFLFYYEPFFADVFRNINKRPTTSIPTAGVAINIQNAEVDLFYNPLWFNKLNISEIYFVIKHEVYHILLGHIFERARKPNKLWNICTDAVINKMVIDDLYRMNYSIKEDVDFNIKYENIGSLKSTLITPNSLYEDVYKMIVNGEIPKKRFATQSTIDYYYSAELFRFFKDAAAEQTFDFLYNYIPPSSYESYEFDVHFEAAEGVGEELSDGMKEIAKAKFGKQLEEIIKEAQNRSYGNVPGHLQKHIQLLLAKKTVDWRILLQYFIKATIKGHKYKTIRKINKRFPYLYSGTKHRRYARVLVGIDESGSMCDKLILKLFNEIRGLAEVVQFDVIPFDVGVNEEAKFTWKKGIKIPAYTRTRYGGTEFESVTKYAAEHSYDGLIIVTDCESYFPPTYNVRRMWLTTPEHGAYCKWKHKELVVEVKS